MESMNGYTKLTDKKSRTVNSRFLKAGDLRFNENLMLNPNSVLFMKFCADNPRHSSYTEPLAEIPRERSSKQKVENKFTNY